MLQLCSSYIVKSTKDFRASHQVLFDQTASSPPYHAAPKHSARNGRWATPPPAREHILPTHASCSRPHVRPVTQQPLSSHIKRDRHEPRDCGLGCCCCCCCCCGRSMPSALVAGRGASAWKHVSQLLHRARWQRCDAAHDDSARHCCHFHTTHPSEFSKHYTILPAKIQTAAPSS
jgi:hypothetical protein